MALKRFLVSNGFSVHQAQSILGSSDQTPGYGLTAAGTAVTNAYAPDPHSVLVFTTVAAGSGTILPFMENGDEVWVTNLGANALLAYPASGLAVSGQSFNAGAADATLSISVGKTAIIKKVATLKYIANVSA